MDVYVICVHWLHLFFSDLNYKMVIFLSQTEKKSTGYILHIDIVNLNMFYVNILPACSGRKWEVQFWYKCVCVEYIMVVRESVVKWKKKKAKNEFYIHIHII
jgi:hypothetical protein